MKKKLEAELISIAHRILKLKTKSDVRELHHETQKLYEKLSVLLFVEENFTDLKPTIGSYDIEKRIEEVFNEEEKITVVTPETEKSVEEIVKKLVETEIVLEKELEEEKSPNEVAIETTPVVETKIEQETSIEYTKTEPKTTPVITQPERKLDYFESIYDKIHQEPIFERVETATKTQEPQAAATPINFEAENTESSKVDINFLNHHEALMDAFRKIDSNTASLNDKLKKTIDIGLNDKIAFEKNLFNGSSEDLNRVISQLSTYTSFNEAKDFITNMIKPDYNNWKGKEEYAARFMEIVESKFN